MHKPPNFFDTLSERMLVLAAQKDQDYVLIDGVLKKGTWKTLPNHVHVFIVDGKIQAGPVNTIGKSPEELNWGQVAEDEKAQHPNPNPVREEVTKKYQAALLNLQTIKRKDVRNTEAQKIMYQMAAEDEFHMLFLNTGGKPSPVLDELSKAFADFGNFPLQGSFKDQVIFYKDRVSLLEQLRKVAPEEAQKDVDAHIGHIQDLLGQLEKRGPTQLPATQDSAVPIDMQDTQVLDLSELDPTQAPTRVMPRVNPQQNQQQRSTTTGPTTQTQQTQQPSGPQQAPNNNVHTVTHTVVSPGGPQKKQPKQKNSPRPRQQVTVPQKQSLRAKSVLATTIEALLRGTFSFIIGSIALWWNKATKKSDSNDVNKMLYSVTKGILSNINVNERDIFFDVFQKSFGLS